MFKFNVKHAKDNTVDRGLNEPFGTLALNATSNEHATQEKIHMNT